MKETIITDLTDVIESISYGDISRNDLESQLESIKESINEHLIEGNE